MPSLSGLRGHGVFSRVFSYSAFEDACPALRLTFSLMSGDLSENLGAGFCCYA